MLTQDIRRRFDPFGYVGIVKDMGLMRHSLLPVEPKGGESTGFLKAFPDIAYRDRAVDFLPVMPKSVVQLHTGKGDTLVLGLTSFFPFFPLDCKLGLVLVLSYQDLCRLLKDKKVLEQPAQILIR